MTRFLMADAPVDLNGLREGLHLAEAGGFCTFEGWVRNSNEGRPVDGLEYESYAELAVKEGERIIEEALVRFEISHAVAMHRTGTLRVGEVAVWIGVSAPHRDAAFRACRYIIDEIKHRVPVWKKEHYLDGDAEWVACHHCQTAPRASDDVHDHGNHHHDHGSCGHQH
ncbi:molybdenum cofactor biosynthesis protein MoaE [Gluconobacter thailandicus]|uniref:Molybdopterin synthase catalytic subunit n=1 Tax=Gluconobacter thailandicus TaxID=257438 RepID=A0AAP9EPJ3_GLUTH|nr:molybdenum cofactor biosynthesis protein MoaE [Gluconobacter thailandicus]QEH95153.1 molybdenum cofactor biosynthesis protein MoaE [Gluconobacter thailandicus]